MPFLVCNVILDVPYESPVCSKVNDLLAEMVVAAAFVHVIFPVVEIAPVNAGDANGVFQFRVVCDAVDIGFVKSLVSSTLARSTIPLVIPFILPDNVGVLIGAEKFWSSLCCW